VVTFFSRRRHKVFARCDRSCAAESETVIVTAGRPYRQGQEVFINDLRPNGERLLATGSVERDNPSNYLLFETELVQSDRLYTAKREVLQSMGIQACVTTTLNALQPVLWFLVVGPECCHESMTAGPHPRAPVVAFWALQASLLASWRLDPFYRLNNLKLKNPETPMIRCPGPRSLLRHEILTSIPSPEVSMIPSFRRMPLAFWTLEPRLCPHRPAGYVHRSVLALFKPVGLRNVGADCTAMIP
jgi:hypothetical protein